MSLDKGKEAEALVAKYLQKQGHVVLNRNFYSRFGELDIITCKDDIVHFIEVKYSKDYDPIERITPQKIVKILKTIQYYMYKENLDYDYQIDAAIVRDKKIEIIENISSL